MEIPGFNTRLLIKEIRQDFRCILSDYKKMSSDQQSKKIQSDSESTREANRKRKDLLYQLRNDSNCMDQNLKFIERENRKRRKDLIRDALERNAKSIQDESLMKREYVRYTFGYGFAIPKTEYIQNGTDGKYLKTTDADNDVNTKNLQKLKIIEAENEAKTDDSQEETEDSGIIETKTETEEDDSQEDTEEKDSGITGSVSEIESEDSQDDIDKQDSEMTEDETETDTEDSQDDIDIQDSKMTEDETKTDTDDPQAEMKRRNFEILEIFALAEESREV